MANEDNNASASTPKPKAPISMDDLLANIDCVKKNVSTLQTQLQKLIESDIYSVLNTEEKVQHDLFVSYVITSLQWMYNRVVGEDVEAIKKELERLQEYMSRAKIIKERKSIPHIDKKAAGRLIKSGLWDPEQRIKKVRFDENQS